MPRLKGLISGNLEPTVQGGDSNFTFCHSLLKKANLEGKSAKCPRNFAGNSTNERTYGRTDVTVEIGI